VFAKNGGEIYALSRGSCNRCLDNLHLRDRAPNCEQRHRFVEKYKPESNSWERVALFDRGAVKIEDIVLFSGCLATVTPACFKARQVFCQVVFVSGVLSSNLVATVIVGKGIFPH